MSWRTPQNGQNVIVPANRPPQLVHFTVHRLAKRDVGSISMRGPFPWLILLGSVE